MKSLWPKSEQGSKPSAKHKFKVGDKVIYVNDFGVCWGVKTITSLETRTYDLWGEPYTKPTYHYEGSDTPWYSVDETNLTKATQSDLTASHSELQHKYGFTPTELYGCW